MQFYLIRHGQSENNRLWALTGSSGYRSEDPALTDLGHQQAEHLARFLAEPGLPAEHIRFDLQDVGGFGLTHLYCSLMIRAVATGRAVARALDLPLVAWEDLHEVGGIHRLDEETGEHHGLPGRKRSYFEEHFPDLVLPESLGEAGWWNRPFEEREQRPARARRFLEELLARHGGSDDRVAVISHGGFYSYLLRALFGISEGQKGWFSLNNTGITRLDFDEESIWLCYANRVDFLPRALVT
jgi:2,3-bisphosphoglycerate-dependent phosphoglycerate mutase